MREAAVGGGGRRGVKVSRIARVPKLRRVLVGGRPGGEEQRPAEAARWVAGAKMSR